jgi:glycine cleavage system pyridoxal-binding protein P
MPTLGARKAGHEVMNPHFFDTVRLSLDCDMSVVQQRARQKQINLRYHTDHTVIYSKVQHPHTSTIIIGLFK